MKKKVLMLILVGVVLGGCGLVKTTADQPAETVQVSEKVVSVVDIDGGVEVWVDATSKVSAVELSVHGDGKLVVSSFEPNSGVFNTVLSNKRDGEKVNVSMGVMKATDELPVGRVMLGKVLCQSGSGKLLLSNLKLIGPGEGGKATQLLLGDFEFLTTVK